MTKTSSGRLVGENHWPLGLDLHDPEGVAEFLLGLDYDADNVVNTLVTRCNLDRITARRIVNAAHNNKQGGMS